MNRFAITLTAAAVLFIPSLTLLFPADAQTRTSSIGTTLTRNGLQTGNSGNMDTESGRGVRRRARDGATGAEGVNSTANQLDSTGGVTQVDRELSPTESAEQRLSNPEASEQRLSQPSESEQRLSQPNQTEQRLTDQGRPEIRLNEGEAESDRPSSQLSAAEETEEETEPATFNIRTVRSANQSLAYTFIEDGVDEGASGIIELPNGTVIDLDRNPDLDLNDIRIEPSVFGN